MNQFRGCLGELPYQLPDGKSTLAWVEDDGGRAAAGFRGRAGDCVARSVAIASGRPYREVYDALAAGTAGQKNMGGRDKNTSGRRTARDGVFTGRKWFKDYMACLGFRWVPTMQIGSGCTVSLVAGALPAGRLVVAVSKHYTAVIDGVIRDTYDPQRQTFYPDGKLGHRCVYGYWILEGAK